LNFTPALAGFALLAFGTALAQQQPPQAQTPQPRPLPTQTAQPQPLLAENAWVRATPGVDTAAAYLTLRNVSSSAVTVTSVESPLAGHAMIHETTTQGGQSRMRAHEQLTVAARSTVRFEPGGLHIMLHDLKQPLTVGASVPLVLGLTGGQILQVTAAVRPLSAE
jgi:periplasmic copper chaperone A